MDSGQVQVCRDGHGSRWNKTCTVQKWGVCQYISTKYIGKPPHAHWALHILQIVLVPTWAGHKTLEIHLVKSASTRDNISKGGYGTNSEPMEYIGPKVIVKAQERDLSGQILARTDPSRRLYIKIDWSKNGMGVLLLQADVSEKARK